MSKKAVNLSLHEKVLQEAEAVMTLRGISNLTVLVEELLRGEYEKRFGPVIAKPEPSTAELADKIEDAALAEIAQRQRPESEPPDTPAPLPTPPTPPAKARSTKAAGRSPRR